MGIENAPITQVMPRIHPDVIWLFWLFVLPLLTVFMLHLAAVSNRMTLRLYLLYWWTRSYK